MFCEICMRGLFFIADLSDVARKKFSLQKDFFTKTPNCNLLLQCIFFLNFILSFYSTKVLFHY